MIYEQQARQGGKTERLRKLMAKTNEALASKIGEKKINPLNTTAQAPTVTTAPPPPKTLDVTLDARANQFREALSGSGMSWDRFKRIVVTEVAGNEDLRYAAGVNPASLLASVFEIASLGLDPSIPNEVFLIPRNCYPNAKHPPEVTVMTGYKGLAKLAQESARDQHTPLVTLRADIIYENDVYVREFGDKPMVSHSPPPFGHDRGKVLGYVAVARDVAGRVNFREMTVSQVEEHKKRFSKVERGPFADPKNFDAYGLKTVMRALINKDLTMGPKLARATAIDADREDSDMLPNSGPAPMLLPEPDPIVPPTHVEPEPEPTPEPQKKEAPKAPKKEVPPVEEAEVIDERNPPPLGYRVEIPDLNRPSENPSLPKKDPIVEKPATVEIPKQSTTAKPGPMSSVVASVASKTGLSTFQKIQEKARLMREGQLEESKNGKAIENSGNVQGKA